MNAFAVTKTLIDYKRNPNAWTDQESASQIYSLKNMLFYLYILGTLLAISLMSSIVEQFYANGASDKIYEKAIVLINVQITLPLAKVKLALETKIGSVKNKKRNIMIITGALFVSQCIILSGEYLHHNRTFKGQKFGAVFMNSHFLSHFHFHVSCSNGRNQTDTSFFP